MSATKDFEELFACFDRHSVRAMIVGAYAVAFHAKPRYTKDLDILVEPSEENARRLIRALADFGFGSLDLSPADFSSPGNIVQLGFPPNRIDLITAVDGISFEEAWAGRVRGRFGEREVDYLGRKELIRNKEASGRAQDLLDLEWLREKE